MAHASTTRLYLRKGRGEQVSNENNSFANPEQVFKLYSSTMKIKYCCALISAYMQNLRFTMFTRRRGNICYKYRWYRRCKRLIMMKNPKFLSLSIKCILDEEP